MVAEEVKADGVPASAPSLYQSGYRRLVQLLDDAGRWVPLAAG